MRGSAAAKPFEAFRFTGASGGGGGQKRTASEKTTASPPPPKKKTLTAPPPPSQSTLPIELFGDSPLRCIIVGHNPSETAWRLGHYYANPNNWMWRILRDTGIAPTEHIHGAADDYKMPQVAGVGFTDVGGGVPGTDSSQFTKNDFAKWRQPFFDRLAAHVERANKKLGCGCGKCGAPKVVAFSGKRQFAELFHGGGGGGKKKKTMAVEESTTLDHQIRLQSTRPSTIAVGKQSVLPQGWPLPLDSTEVWVMSSTSGAAAMTREQRYAPWEALAARIAQEPWPSSTSSSRCNKQHYLTMLCLHRIIDSQKCCCLPIQKSK